VSVDIKSAKEIEAMRVACRKAAETLVLVGEKLRPGMTTKEIDEIVHEDTLRRGGYPAPLNYHGFPKSVCTSINDVVCHGIPGDEILRTGDIINVDVTTIYDGFHGDTSATFYIGVPSAEARHVVETARKALDIGIQEVREGARLGDVGAAIQEYVEAEGCSVVRDFVGHGIGRKFQALRQTWDRRKTQGRDDLHHRADGQRRRLGSERRPDRQVDGANRRRFDVCAIRAHLPRHKERGRGIDQAR
jgi:methionyl aminopeptidase